MLHKIFDTFLRRRTYATVGDGEWHHICVSWESSSGSWKFYKDGGLAEDGTNLKRGYTIRQGGTLVFGQEQDSVGGGFQVSQSFQGKLSGINVWDHVLTSAKIKEMSTTCVLNEEDNGNVYKWVEILRTVAVITVIFFFVLQELHTQGKQATCGHLVSFCTPCCMVSSHSTTAYLMNCSERSNLQSLCCQSKCCI